MWRVGGGEKQNLLYSCTARVKIFDFSVLRAGFNLTLTFLTIT